MPLSKARDKERKAKGRARNRLDKLLLNPRFGMRLRERKVKPIRCCEVCGYSETVDIHHEGEWKEEHILCPNHHGLITRGIRTLKQLLPSQTLNPVQPNNENAEMARQMLPLQMKAYAIANETDADGNQIPEM